MKRREFVTLLRAAAFWPLAARAQGDRVRRIGVLMPTGVDDAVAKVRLAAFQDGLAQLGWSDGRNIRIDVRWSGGGSDETREQAAELVALGPDVILADGNAAMAPLRQVTRTVPVVFSDRARSGRRRVCQQPVASRRQRHRFTSFEFSISEKWLELLKEIAPGVKRAAILRDADIAAGIGQFGAIQNAALSLGL